MGKLFTDCVDNLWWTRRLASMRYRCTMGRLDIGMLAAVVVLLVAVVAQAAASAGAMDNTVLAEKLPLKMSTRASAKFAYSYKKRSDIVLQDQSLTQCGVFNCYECTDGSDWGLQTNFACADKEHDNSFVLAGGLGSVGHCTWTVNFYTSGPVGDTNDGIGKYGDVKAVCGFGHALEQCGGPSCEKMLLELEGHMYDTDIASHTPSAPHRIGSDSGNSFTDYNDPSCCMLEYFGGTDTLADIDFSPCLLKKKREGAPRNTTLGGTHRLALPWNNVPGGRKWPVVKKTPANADNAAKIEAINYDQADGTIYAGYGLVFTGIATVTTIGNNGQQTVEETGLFEYPFITYTEPLPAGQSVPEGTHWITADALKLTLFEEESKGEHYSTSNIN